MTRTSQSRLHAGKRGAAQRKARRQGYSYAGDIRDSGIRADLVLLFISWMNIDQSRKFPRLTAAFLHGVQDWARKHGGAA
ncbi:hypothetical protein AA103196_3111 [Ameyamaea chiangmaiensis NBRC 103196]|uniref:Uncharacterized protein n=1 Tax=Ameyamaea chiangmaiensis TaxID=442969 RepID=A0A850P8Q2_9PROT|nr:hypothetical protein [Ameyamaea chiangmaiensis]MBS4074597.1 hypothetical protein [Ameyamaea chiangmaiensis]NVN39353.1 hypothetical protein [Ameyamaea chiangmaiensis]GBQ72619.1 hypothetical protein AA103196_3111 [Ameyamaea chiangmaiensis NBRC 103196]